MQLSRNWRPAAVAGLPEVFTGGWVGYAGYDTVRYVYASECRGGGVCVGVFGVVFCGGVKCLWGVWQENETAQVAGSL